MKLLKLFITLTMVAPVCWAADSQALAERLMDLSGTESAMTQGFELGFQPVLNQMKSQGMPEDLLNEITTESRKFFTDNFKWADVKPEFAKLYINAFSESELGDLVKFYESPTGKKAASKLPSLMQQGAAFSMGRIQSKMPEFQQKVMAIIQDYRAKHMPAPASPSAPAAAETAPMTPPATGTAQPAAK